MSVICEHGYADRNVYGQCRICKRRWSEETRRRRAEAAAADRASTPLPVPVAGDWVVAAACRRYDPDWWFPDGGGHGRAAAALRVCREECPVMLHCRAHAARLRLTGMPWHGVWGGLRRDELRRAVDAERVLADTERVLGVGA